MLHCNYILLFYYSSGKFNGNGDANHVQPIYFERPNLYKQYLVGARLAQMQNSEGCKFAKTFHFKEESDFSCILHFLNFAQVPHYKFLIFQTEIRGQNIIWVENSLLVKLIVTTHRKPPDQHHALELGESGDYLHTESLPHMSHTETGSIRHALSDASLG